MWNKKTNKKLGIIVVVAMFGFLLINVALLELSKRNYSHNVRHKLQNLAQQQRYLLQRLSKNLLDPISRRDFEIISVNLRVYEDLSFVLSKQELAVPLSLHYVSLTAPQQIMSSNGIVDNHILAPDDAYYLKVAEEPNSLIFSKPYVKPEMPGYLLSNWGWGITHNNIYHGQLDAKVAIDAVHNYVVKNLPFESKIFDFKLSNSNILQPKIIVRHLEYIVALLSYTIIEMIILLAIIFIKIAILHVRKVFVLNKSDLIVATNRLEFLANQNTLIKMANELQYRYGAMLNMETTVLVKQLLDDIYTVNAPLAAERKITLVFPEYTGNNMQFQGNNLRLMQILSGMLYEIMFLLAENSTVNLQFIVTDLQKDVQQLQFKFSDNGFYNKLGDRNVPMSYADVRSNGWNNINALIELEDGVLEHQHTTYSGNVITFTIVRKISQKIVNIESYYS